jgi:hypothetical protein
MTSLAFIEIIVACSIENSLLLMWTSASGMNVENIHSNIIEFIPLCLQKNIQNNIK